MQTTNSLENTSYRKILMNCMFDRFVDFVGIEFEQMKMGFVLLAERFVWIGNMIYIKFWNNINYSSFQQTYVILVCLLSLELIYNKHSITFLFQSVRSKKYSLQIYIMAKFSDKVKFFL